jgi:tight adherence protein C
MNFNQWLDLITNIQFLLSIGMGTFVFIIFVIILGQLGNKSDIQKRMNEVEKQRRRMRDERLGSGSTFAVGKKGDTNVTKKLQNLKNSNIKIFDRDDIRLICLRAGFRSQHHVAGFVIAQFICITVVFALAMTYFFLIIPEKHPLLQKILFSVGAGLVGFFLPNIYMKNIAKKRQGDLQGAFSDTLDLLLICVESGMSIENAMHKIVIEIGRSSKTLAEEIAITTAELSFLPDRKMAYDNLAKRSGLKSYKSLATVLIQSEKYGTPLGQGLRVLAQEQRELAIQEIERKAAALPAKLTVPLIIFFMPVLFTVIMAPALIQVFETV